METIQPEYSKVDKMDDDLAVGFDPGSATLSSVSIIFAKKTRYSPSTFVT